MCCVVFIAKFTLNETNLFVRTLLNVILGKIITVSDYIDCSKRNFESNEFRRKINMIAVCMENKGIEI